MNPLHLRSFSNFLMGKKNVKDRNVNNLGVKFGPNSHSSLIKLSNLHFIPKRKWLTDKLRFENGFKTN